MTAGFWAAVGQHITLHLILHSTGLAVLLSGPFHSFPLVSAYLLLSSLPEAAGGLLTGEPAILGLCECVSLMS
ncbi:uncharacterized [Tachysurus ichikawai]